MKTMDASGIVSAPSKVRQPVTMCAASSHRCTVCRPSKPTGSPHCQYLHSLRVESHATAWSRRVGTRAEGGDLSESVDWVRRAAEGGLGLAMSRLATVLRNGKSVPRDDAAAARWYRCLFALFGNSKTNLLRAAGVMFKTVWAAHVFPFY